MHNIQRDRDFLRSSQLSRRGTFRFWRKREKFVMRAAIIQIKKAFISGGAAGRIITKCRSKLEFAAVTIRVIQWNRDIRNRNIAAGRHAKHLPARDGQVF